MFENCPDRVCWWQGTLSINRRICLSLRFNSRFNFDIIVVMISVFIQALLLAKLEQLYSRLGDCKFLKHLGLTDVLITTGSSFSPSAFTKNAHVSCCFACFPPVPFLSLASRVFSGRPPQKHPVSSIFQTTYLRYLLPQRPFCCRCCTSAWIFQASRWKQQNRRSNFSAINVASSWSIVYQSHTAWFTSEYLDERFLFAWFGVSLLA